MNLDELIVALVNHPRFRAAMLNMTRKEAARMYLQHGAPASAPVHQVTYEQASVLLGVKQQTVRLYVCNGKLRGGSGYVDIDSVITMKTRMGK